MLFGISCAGLELCGSNKTPNNYAAPREWGAAAAVYSVAVHFAEDCALRRIFSLIVLFSCVALSSPAPRASAADGKNVVLPPAAARPVDFENDIRPMLTNSCLQCHGGGKAKGEFRIDTRATFLKGGESGPAAVVGDSSKSLVVQLVSGMDEEKLMPQKSRPLSSEQIGLLRAWIDQGMKWPDGMTFAAGKSAPLAPRIIALPATADRNANPIDVLLAPYFAKNHVAVGQVVDNRVYARRVWLDVTGLLPPPDALEAFVADAAPDKRAKLVDRLLNDKKPYTEHWLSFWNDLLRNDYKGTGYIDGGRKQITSWLYQALSENMPFDQFVRELVSGASGSEGFIKGIVWRGVVNAAQTPQMQAAQNVSQVFMGANLKCASCHDSFVSQWLLADSYGLAGIYADAPLEMERCSNPLGKVAPMKFLYPELGAIDPALPRDQRLRQLASIITSDKNGRLGRTIVNRLWKKFLGRGLVEPVDEMDQAPWDADLLDWLAVDLATTNKWDLKKTIARILTSKAYQMPMAAVAEGGNEQFTFRGPVAKRLTAEEFVDALGAVTGVWPAKPAFDPAVAPTVKLPHRKARWVWSTPKANQSAAPGVVYFRKEFDLDSATSGEAIVTADNRFVLYVNGKRVAAGEDWGKPVAVDLRPYLVSNGKNVIAVEAENTTTTPNPAGLYLTGRITHRKVTGSPAVELATNATWQWSDKPAEGWQSVGFTATNWKPAVELGDEKAGPWKLTQTLAAGVTVTAGPATRAATRPIRAALCTADPLMTALGRSNREQVLTDRNSVATTLQALEMSNGATLSEMLKKGAAKLATGAKSPQDLTDRLFLRALGRKPTTGELATATEMLGADAKIKPEAVEDLLWVIAMLPEFQLIR
jgi:hypothetical protein